MVISKSYLCLIWLILRRVETEVNDWFHVSPGRMLGNVPNDMYLFGGNFVGSLNAEK